jgi:poly(3-hydroxybutyrate) depolymerase
MKFLLLIGILYSSVIFSSEEINVITLFEGIERRYLLYIPDAWKPTKKLPLVVALHPWNKTPELYITVTNAKAIAERYGHIIALPKAGTDAWDNGFETDEEKPYDDMGFILKMLKEIKAKYDYDEKRVYAMGYSSGAFMAYRVGAELQDTFAAIGLTGGAVAVDIDYQNTNPIPAIIFHGDSDWIVAMNPGEDPLLDSLSARESLEIWKKVNKVQDSPIKTFGIVNANAKASLEYNKETYLPLVESEGSVIEFYSLVNCLHNFPFRMLWQPTDKIFQFFNKYKLKD